MNKIIQQLMLAFLSGLMACGMAQAQTNANASKTQDCKWRGKGNQCGGAKGSQSIA